MSRRGVTALGLAAAGGVGYYLYTAGGDPKTAEKKFEADVSKASRKVQNELPGREKEAEKKGQAMMSEAGTKFDKAAADAKSGLKDAEKKAEEYKQRTGKELNQAIDKFDKTVEDGAAKAKSGVSGWFK